MKTAESETKDMTMEEFENYVRQTPEYIRAREGCLKAIAETNRICKGMNVLKDFLETKESEVRDILLAQFDRDYMREIYAHAFADEVPDETPQETAKRMLKTRKFSVKEIASVTELPAEEILKMIDELMQTV